MSWRRYHDGDVMVVICCAREVRDAVNPAVINTMGGTSAGTAKLPRELNAEGRPNGSPNKDELRLRPLLTKCLMSVTGS